MKKRPPIPFTVDRHTCVTKFPDSTADDVIQDGIDLLAEDDTPKSTGFPKDIPTDIALDFKGHVGTFSKGNGIVKTEDDLDALFGLPGNVHVVCEIHCCGGEKPGILGCCGLGQPIIVKEGIGPESAPVLWMHEFGHYKGLCHRDDRLALMAPTINVANKTVNQYEHDVFEDIVTPSKCKQKKKKPTAIGAIEFVHKVFIEGVPYEQANRFTPDAVDPLLKLLHKPGKQRSRLNVITVLGVIGDRRAWKPIKKAFERGSGELSQQNYAAKLAVPLALGYLLAKGHDPHDQEILEYLNSGLNHPSEWSKRVSWRKSHDQDDQTRNAHLTMLTILGLGISGRIEALTALQTLHAQLEMQIANSHGASATKTGEAITSNRTTGLSDYEPGTLSVLKAAIKTNKRVHQDGLVKYYRDSEMEQLGFNL